MEQASSAARDETAVVKGGPGRPKIGRTPLATLSYL